MLETALAYHDLDGLERDFVEASRLRREQRSRRRIAWLSGGLLLALGLTVLAGVGWRNADRLRGFTERQSDIVTAFLDKRLADGLLLAVQNYRKVDEATAQRELFSALRYTQQAYAPFFPLRYLHGHANPVAQLAFSADSSKVAATDGTFENQTMLTIWDTASGEVQPGDAFEPAESLLVLEDTTFRMVSPVSLWQELNGVRSDFFAKDAGSDITSAALSPDSRTLALGYDDGTVILWSVRGSDRPLLGQVLKPSLLAPRFGPALTEQLLKFNERTPGRRSAFGQAARLLAFSSGEGTLSLWEVESESVGRLADIPTGGAVRSLAVDLNGRRLAWLEDANKLVLWDIVKESRYTFPENPDTAVLSLAFGPKGELLLGQPRGMITVWEPERVPVTHELFGLEGSVLNPSLSSRDTLAVTDSQGFAYLGRLEGSRSLIAPDPLSVTDFITALAFSPDGSKLALGTGSGTVILLQVERREVIGELGMGGNAEVLSLAFAGGNDQLVSSHADGRVMRWDIGVELLLGQACRIANPPAAEVGGCDSATSR